MAQRQWISLERLASKMNYHRGFISDDDEARDSLQRALKYDRNDVDILIAMYRKPGDATWRRNTISEIERVARQWLAEVNRGETNLLKGNNPDVKIELAYACNQFAWLIANTEGDKAMALRLSRRSVELFPNESAYLDTLARCYFEVGDLQQAITYQRIALGVEPHQLPMQRQLKMFLDEQAKRDSKVEPKPNDGQDAGGS